MMLRTAIAATVVAGLGLTAEIANAQVAAEEAVVLSGTSAGTGRASSELGGAVSGSIRGAAGTISSVPSAAPRGAPRRSRGSVAAPSGALAADSDPLEKTDAPAYQLSNGATLRVSGGMRNSTAARCTQNCGTKKRTNVVTVGRRPAPSEETPGQAEPQPQAEATKPD